MPKHSLHDLQPTVLDTIFNSKTRQSECNFDYHLISKWLNHHTNNEISNWKRESFICHDYQISSWWQLPFIDYGSIYGVTISIIIRNLFSDLHILSRCIQKPKRHHQGRFYQNLQSMLNIYYWCLLVHFVLIL